MPLMIANGSQLTTFSLRISVPQWLSYARQEMEVGGDNWAPIVPLMIDGESSIESSVGRRTGWDNGLG
jgi:hypothetical protein